MTSSIAVDASPLHKKIFNPTYYNARQWELMATIKFVLIPTNSF